MRSGNVTVSDETKAREMLELEVGVPETLRTAREIVQALPARFHGQRWTRDLERSIHAALDAQAGCYEEPEDRQYLENRRRGA